MILSDCPIHFMSKMQGVVAPSSAESELYTTGTGSGKNTSHHILPARGEVD